MRDVSWRARGARRVPERLHVEKLTTEQQESALRIVAAWMGRAGGTDDGSPVPTGNDAASRGIGPVLVPEWDWPMSGPTPTVILEGGPYDWAIRVSCDERIIDEMLEVGVWCEAYASYALCLYAA